MGTAHVVPLSKQALRIIRALQRITGGGRLLFPSLIGRDRPISENSPNAALRRLGYSKEEQNHARLSHDCINAP